HRNDVTDVPTPADDMQIHRLLIVVCTRMGSRARYAVPAMSRPPPDADAGSELNPRNPSSPPDHGYWPPVPPSVVASGAGGLPTVGTNGVKLIPGTPEARPSQSRWPAPRTARCR